jgi:carboxymethylenebutenolidase
MKEFQADGRTISGYLAVPEQGSGPGVLVLHAWWGLTDVFKQVCDRLAREGFIALAPDLYHGKTTTSIDEAEELASERIMSKEAFQDLAASIDYLLKQPGRGGKALGAIGFSLGGFWALGLSDQMAALVTFYGTTPLERVKAKADVLGHFAEHDDFEPVEQVRQFEEDLRSSGRHASFFLYPGTHHWFFEENRPEYDAEAARIAWERTIEFLHQRLDEAE